MRNLCSTLISDNSLAKIKNVERHFNCRSTSKILLVDDEEICLLITKNNLTQLGYLNVDIARNGKEALTMCKQYRYDLIITDISMPKLNGIEFAKKLRHSQSARSLNNKNFTTPIIALTSDNSTTTRNNCLVAGIAEIEHKPISSKRLAYLISHFCSDSFCQIATALRNKPDHNQIIPI